MFNNATSLLFYVANLANKVTKVNPLSEVLTVCPPGIDSLDEYGYNRAIHLSLKFIINFNALPKHVFYMTFRYTLPHRMPSQFSSIEILDSHYRSVMKFKYTNTLDFFSYLQNFENVFMSLVSNPAHDAWTSASLVGAQ